MSTVTRTLPVPLTPEELRERGAALAEVVECLRKVRVEKREAAKAFKEREDGYSSERPMTELEKARAAQLGLPGVRGEA